MLDSSWTTRKLYHFLHFMLLRVLIDGLSASFLLKTIT